MVAIAYENVESLPLPAPEPRLPHDPGPSGEVVRHILVGSPEGVRQTIQRLYLCRYAPPTKWTGPVTIGPDGIHIPQDQGQVLYYLMRLRSFDRPTP